MPKHVIEGPPDPSEDPEEVRVFWVPELAENPIDLTQQLAEPKAMMAQPVPLDTEEIEIVYLDEILAIEAIPEGTLTPVYSGGELVGHAEVIHNEDGSRTIKVYGLTHNPEEQP